MKKKYFYLLGIILFASFHGVRAQISEDFESGLGLFSNGSTNDVNWVVETTLFHGGAQSVKNEYQASNSNILFLSSAIDLTSFSGTPMLSFYHIAKTEGGWDEAIVEVSTDGGSTFSPLLSSEYQGSGVLEADGTFDEDSYSDWGTSNTTPNNTWWKNELFDLSAYVGSSQFMVRFRLESDTSAQRAGWYLDDVEVMDVTCAMPSNVSLDFAGDVNAMISWTSGASAWDVEYGPVGFTPTGTPTGSGVTSNPYPISGLSPQTPYDFYVRADCGGGDLSAWVGPFTFETACQAVSAPFYEDFSSSSTPSSCWVESGDTSWDYSTSAAYAASSAGDHTPGGGTNYAWIDGSDNTDFETGVLETPLIDVSSLSKPVLQFYVFSDNTNNDLVNDLEVEFYDGASWNLLTTVNTLDGNWRQYIFNLSGVSTITGAVQFRFTVTGADESLTGGQTYHNDILIDDISVENVLCLPPASLSVASVTANTAELSWNADPSINSWNVQVVPEGAGLMNIATDTGVTNPFVKTGLDPNTAYDFYVQSDCGGDGFSDWIGPFTFTTACPLEFEAPWNDDVEGHMAVEDFTDSRCWTANSISDFNWNVDGGGSTPTSNTGPSGANSGNNYFYVESTGGAQGDEAELISPLINIDLLSSPVLSFYYHMYGDDTGELHIDVNNGASWDNDLLVISGQQQASAGDAWEEAKISLQAYTSVSTVQVRFRAVRADGGTGDIAIDDVTIQLGDACAPPLGVSASNVTATTADVGWFSTVNESLWNVEVVPTGSSATGVPTASGVSNPYMVTNLTPVTSYEVYVQSDCGADGSSEWVGPITFTTECDVYPAPFYEDFESGSTPDCWSESGDESWIYTTGADYAASSAGDHTAGGGTNYAWVDQSGNSSGDKSSLSTPLVDVSNLNSAAVSFYVFSNNTNNSTVNTLEIEFYDGANWNLIQTVDTHQSGWREYIVGLSENYTITGPVQIRFSVISSSGASVFYNDVLIDDVSIDEAPTCLDPTSLNATSITSNSAELSWMPGGTESSWDVEVVSAGSQPTGVPTDPGVTSPYVKTGLSSASSYDFYVRADCGTVDGFSGWAGPYTFDTACGAITAPFTETFASSTTPNCWTESGDSAWDYSTSAAYAAAAAGDHTAGGGTNYAWIDGSDNTDDEVSSLITPEIDLSSLVNPLLEFYVFSDNDDHPGANPLDVEIYDGVNWVLVETINTLDSSWRQYSVNIANVITVNGNIKVRFTVTGDDTEGFTFNNDVLIDDVSVIESPPCIEPGALDASNITSTSAELSWSSQGNEVSWDVEVVEAGTAPSGTPTDTNVTSPFVKTGLDPNTSYDFYVRAYCGTADGYSTWAGPITFTTLCEVIVAPYMQSFVDASIPDCWSVEGDNPDAWMFSTGADNAASDAGDHTSGSTNYAWVDGDDNDDGETASLVSPLMDLSSLTVPSLEFYMFSDNTDDAAINEMEVEFYDGANWNTLDTFTNLLGSNWYRFVFDLSTYTISGDVQFRFTVTGAANGGDISNHDILIDDIVVDEMPNPCLEPEQVSIFNYQLDQVDIAWLDFNNSNSWTIEYGPQGFVQGNGTTETVSSLPFTIDNLSSGTEYDVYIQTDCGGGSTSDWVKASFEPLVIGARCDVAIDIANLPYNFTGNTGDYQNWYSGEPGSDCGTSEGYLNGNETVYKYTAANDDLVDIKLSNITGLYASVFVYESCGDIGNSCVAGVVAGPTEMDLDILEFEMTSGQEYIIVVSSWLNPSVDYTLDIIPFDCSSFEAPNAQANQDFVTGETLADLEVEGTKSNVTFKYYDSNNNQLAETDALVDGETYDVVQVFNGCDSAAVSITVSEIDCSALAITAVFDDSANCRGTMQLSATASGTGDDVYWYDAATGGNLVGIGSDFITPNLDTTTSYWAAEVELESGTGSGGGTLQSYCDPVAPTFGCSSGDDIDDFILTNSLSGASIIQHEGTGCASSGYYTDYTSGSSSLTGTGVLVAGQNYDVYVTHNYTTSQYVRIWIDLDNNGTFDPAESLYESGSTTSPTQGTFTVPQSALGTTTVMRVMNRFAGNPADPCNAGGSFGEVHDYKVIITGASVLCESPRQEAVAMVNQSGDELVDYTDLPYEHSSSTSIYGNDFSGDPGSDCPGAEYLDGNEVIYKYTADPANDDVLTIELSDITNTATGIYLYSSCGLIGIDCLDGLTSEGLTSVAFEDYYVNAGEDLFIVVSSESGSVNYTLTINGLDCNNIDEPNVETTSPYFVNGNTLSNIIPLIGLDGSVYNEGFTWYDDQALTNVIDPSQEIISSDKTYYVTQTILGCESNPVAIDPVEFDCDGLSIDTDILPYLCAPGGEVTLTATPSGTGSYVVWYSDDESGVILGTGETLVIDIDRTTSVWVAEIFTRESAVECSTEREEVVINVNYTPTQIPAGDSVQEFCEGARVSDISVTGTEVIWYADESSNEMVPSNQMLTNGDVYYATQTINGCESDDRLQVTVDVKETSLMPDAPINQSFDLGETVADLQVQGDNLNWYADEFGINPIPTPTTEVLEDQETYYVSQTLNGECESELVGITVHVGSLDADDIVFSSLKYYPNPTSSSLFIKNNVSIDNIEVYNLLGQKLMTKNINSMEAEINISHLASGTYMVKISVDNKSTIVKILKE